MAALNWPQALAWVRQDEGGNDDDPADSGGRTSRGITQKEFNEDRREHGLPLRDVWQASDTEIDAIYDRDYWFPEGDNFPTGIDYLYFDMKVNAGPHRAAILLQRALGVHEDGEIGPVTNLALRGADHAGLIADYSRFKRMFYVGLANSQPHDRKFLRGWLARCDRVEARARSLLTGEAIA